MSATPTPPSGSGDAVADFAQTWVDTSRHTMATLRALANLGIRLAIDDFGVGHANHAYLQRLPVHAIKLDASFADALTAPTVETKAEAIMTNLVGLGHILGLTVTAEGVETAAQAALLTTMHCDLGQGWHFGRPAPADRITALLTAGTPRCR